MVEIIFCAKYKTIYYFSITDIVLVFIFVFKI